MFRNEGAKGAALTAFLGLVFLILPAMLGLDNRLANLSYDWSFWPPLGIDVNEAAIVYMDEASERSLQQSSNAQWDRSLHANLLTNLAKAGAQAVVFDVMFSEPGTNRVGRAADTSFISAARYFGGKKKVIVGAVREPILHNGYRMGWMAPEHPFNELADVVGWGLVVAADESKSVREHFRDPLGKVESLAWRAAETLGKAPPDPFAERWINYYGPPGAIPNFSYADVLDGNWELWPSLSNKVVFVGAKRGIGFTGGTGTDDYRTPYTRSTGQRAPGVEINATTALNLIRGDWLRRLSPILECLLIVLGGAALGLGLTSCRPMAAAGWGVLACLLVSSLAIVFVWRTHVWFSWMIVVAIQVPCALGWSVLTHTKRLLSEKQILEQRLVEAGEVLRVHPTNTELKEALVRSVAGAAKDAHTVSPTTAEAQAQTVAAATPVVHDHLLLARIGQGGYGEVWLARDILGSYHAVKIVYRSNFSDVAPYEREFNGLKRFTPISRLHPGLVNILHVGRNSKPEYIYYIMEAGDDEVAGQTIDPNTYVPKTLARELKKRKRLPLGECLQLSVDLASALGFLHRQNLIHRDIKPANIIFVRGVPKLADIGLVTEIATRPSDVSYVGTRGYLAPEGPGTPAADVYSLGKIIYEAAWGMACTAFPELPATLLDQGEGAELLELNRIILRACDNDPDKRFQSAADLQAALVELL